MKRLYEKNEILFAVLWILVYCFTTIPIRGNLGDESIWMTIVLIVIAVSATVFIKINHLEKKAHARSIGTDLVCCTRHR